MSKSLPLFLLCLILVVGCQPKRALITNKERLADMERMIGVQKELTAHSLLPIWNFADNCADEREKQAMQFLYAYMPLSDLADFSPGFMLANARQSLKALEDYPWGKQLPEEEFLHFVLPLRVNNENLDSFRLVCYEEIRNRIKGLPMKEAALEINHWCHEKVNYRGTDGRTSAPLSTIRKSFGRCGEESTFTVSAMRAAGIPARQVYTPRWAHTDDNHAWVEVWIDGKWHYLGACEPDTDLDRGWFSEPSQRTMMVHTRTYGKYFGSEEVLQAEARFSELNLTSHYAKTKRITVKVVNPSNQPVEGAKVSFRLYNYAEFYPLTTSLTDRKGSVDLTTGPGDLLVWVTDGNGFTCSRLHVPSTDTLRVTFDGSRMKPQTLLMDFTPPAPFKPIAKPTEAAKAKNDRRLAKEDSIRNSYMATFPDSAKIIAWADTWQLNRDSVYRILHLSYGNWKEMESYLGSQAGSNRKNLLALCSGISDKDLSDTKKEILTDHLIQASEPSLSKTLSREDYVHYLLAPRIDLEILAPWRGFLKENLGGELTFDSIGKAATIKKWIGKNLTIDRNANNHSRAPLTPIGVYRLRVCDPLSRDIFFVAACRTFGIPARLNPEYRFPEYLEKGVWTRAGLEAEIARPAIGTIRLKQVSNGSTPQYYLHFTLGKIQNGESKTLEFEEGKKLSEFPDLLPVEAAPYLLVTGKRLSNGSVLASLTILDIQEGKQETAPVTIRSDEQETMISGNLPLDQIRLLNFPDQGKITLASLCEGKACVLLFADPDTEPSRHILNDFNPYKSDFDKWGGRFLYVAVKGKNYSTKLLSQYHFPAHSYFASDGNDQLAETLEKLTGKDPKGLLPMLLTIEGSGFARV
ncbi:MAG: transglutaminase domain-containing protein, partial [Marinilabiliales bacterium]|nr:transglutaminase domain-containing protein [Marinilabiliales bacterium]